jgi:hypothetical protein
MSMMGTITSRMNVSTFGSVTMGWRAGLGALLLTAACAAI